MSLRIVPGRSSGPSAAMMSRLLASRGVTIHTAGEHAIADQPQAYLYWGCPSSVSNQAALNARPARTKLEELRTLSVGGVMVPVVKETLTAEDFASSPVWFARKLDHSSGRDLQCVFQPDEAEWRLKAGWSYFTARLPIKRELRAWAFRGEYLATYEKKMERPEQFTKLGRNHRNGFAFKRVYSGRPSGLPELANAALIALGLDFGAVDVVETPTGDLFVLEVNTAPGIESEDMGGAKRLADCIKRWYDGVCLENPAQRNSATRSFGLRSPTSNTPTASL